MSRWVNEANENAPLDHREVPNASALHASAGVRKGVILGKCDHLSRHYVAELSGDAA